MKKNKLEEVEFEVLWEDRPSGIWDRFLNLIHMNFTKYQITKDELIIQTGFLNRSSNAYELYTLKDPDMNENIIQRFLGIGTISVTVDTHQGNSDRGGTVVNIRNIKNVAKVRKLLRDAIERDVTERKITYFDKI